MSFGRLYKSTNNISKVVASLASIDSVDLFNFTNNSNIQVTTSGYARYDALKMLLNLVFIDFVRATLRQFDIFITNVISIFEILLFVNDLRFQSVNSLEWFNYI